MTSRTFVIAGVEIAKVDTGRAVHAVETDSFWKGDRSWESRALCGASVCGVVVKIEPLSCPPCRDAVKALGA